MSAPVFRAPGCECGDPPGDVVDDRGEVSGSVEAHGLETLVIRLHHPLDAAAVRVLWVAVLWQETFTKEKDEPKKCKTKDPEHPGLKGAE